MTINKFKSPGNYQPVFKTETKPQANQLITWNKIMVDTDTLCDNNYDQEIMIQIFKYSPKGSHKKMDQGQITLTKLIDSGGSTKINLQKGFVQIDGF